MKKHQGWLRVLIAIAALSLVPSLIAKDSSEVNFQFSGLLPNEPTGGGITDQGTRTGGFEMNYTYLLGKWAGIEGGYGIGRNTQSYSGDFGSAAVQSNLQEVTGAFEVRVPTRKSKIRPYALSGIAALRYGPTGSTLNTPGAVAQTKPAFLYGGGADFIVSQNVAIRGDYRGFISSTPDFQLTGVSAEGDRHLAQPSIGVLVRF